MNITILTHLEKVSAPTTDLVVDQVAHVLQAQGHTTAILGVRGDVQKMLNGLTRPRPDLVFNLMEMFGTDIFADIAVAGLLDLLQVPYTGGGPGELYLRQDKGLAKKLLAFDNVRYPDFAVFSKDADLETGGHLHLPLIVKPLRTDASLGIDGRAVVHTTADLMKQVLKIQSRYNDAALVEEYIEGREFYVGVLGNQEPQALPPIEMDFSGLPAGSPRILDRRAKWVKDSKAYKGTKAVVADIPADLKAQLQTVALNAYRALRVRDYGRVDLRLTPTNEVYVIEVNASCYLEQSSEFVMAATAAGMTYSDLIKRIADLALARHGK